jgi:FixJ family two-component response regulator
MAKLDIYVVDDDVSVRHSLGVLLLSRGHAVQSFESGQDFLASADLQRRGCVILDLRMPCMSGLQVFDELRARGSALVVLFLSGHGDISSAVEAVQKGALGWLEKPCKEADLLEKLEQASQLADQRKESQRANQAATLLWRKLTPREKEIARLVASGKSNKLIARELAPLMTRTVETHRAHVFAKLNIGNSTQLDRFFRDHQI